MKKYKNILLSIAFYALTVAWFLYADKNLAPLDPSLEMYILISSGLLAIPGIIFGVKSLTEKETGWIGYIDVLIGIVIVFFTIFLLTLGSSPI